MHWPRQLANPYNHYDYDKPLNLNLACEIYASLTSLKSLPFLGKGLHNERKVFKLLYNIFFSCGRFKANISLLGLDYIY